MECEEGYPEIGAGQTVTFDSATAGNPPRYFCFVAPSGTSEVKLMFRGGVCDNGECTEDEAEIFLKHGDVPNPSDPDGATKEWGFTPGDGAFGDFGTGGGPGAWYIAIRDNGVGLGYQDVSLSVEFP